MNFHGDKRSNPTHQSTTDPEAMLYRKSGGRESKQSSLGQVLMENRNGLVVNTRLTQATGTAERHAALFTFAAAYNLVRMRNLAQATA